jgi:anti-sigma factor RsiW
MPNCQLIDPLVTPFVDGELADAERRLVQDHLAACPSCHSRVTAERAVHELIRTRKQAICERAAPVTLHDRCAGFARRDATADRAGLAKSAIPNLPSAISHLQSRPSWRSRLAPFALAASLVILVGGAFLYQATDRSARLLAAELTADHVKCFAVNSALGTRQMPAAVESSMASMFDWRMHLPDNPGRAGLELVGARPCLYGQGKVAHIMYRHEGHPVSLFMLPKTARAQQLVRVLGHEAAIWCVGNRTFVLVAREPRAQVERLVSFVQASMQ